MRKRTFLTVLILSFVCSGLWAQKAKLRQAQRYVESFNYPSAIAIYLDLAQKHGHPEAIFQLADLYRKVNAPENALLWYEKAVTLPNPDPVVFYNYGRMLQRLGQCELAKEQYQQFLKLRPFDSRKSVLQSPCAYEEQLRTAYRDRIEVRPLNFNSPNDDIGPAFFGDGLVFGSLRLPETAKAKKDRPFFDLYFAESTTAFTDPFSFGMPTPFSPSLNSSLHEAIVTFNREQSEIFLTRNYQGKEAPEWGDIVRLEIMSAQRLDSNQWSALVPLPFNGESYSTAHPSLSPDGQMLYFSSDMPGGFGGKDIYVSRKEGGNWTTPANLGPAINTEGDELFPFYDLRGRLYFTSDGLPGLGGQDIFHIEDRGNGDWANLTNMGYPVNSEYDDYSLILSEMGDYGYFTSNRPGGTGEDDIYGFRFRENTLRITLVDGDTGAKLEGIAGIRCMDYSVSIDDQHRYVLRMPPGACCTLEITADAYLPLSKEVCSPSGPAGDQELQVALQPVAPPKAVDQVDLLMISGRVIDLITNQALANVPVIVAGGSCMISDTTYTDEAGHYLFSLAGACCYDLKVEKKNYFTFRTEEAICPEAGSKNEIRKDILLQPYARTTVERINAQPNDTAVQPSNFRPSISPASEESIAYLLNIYYDLGRTSVRRESVPELRKLLRLLENNPDLVLEISSHTDSRGSASYNERLSQRRAENIVRWLVSEGIDRLRLIPKGYGENQLVNDCTDDHPCSEAEHQLNRRTEFRVLGQLPKDNR